MKVSALDEHLAFTKDFVASRVAATTSEQGIPAMALYLDYEGNMAFCAIDNSYMQNAETKDNLAVVMRKLAREKKAVTMLFISEVWTRAVTIERVAEERKLFKKSIAGLPGSIEKVMIQEVRGDGAYLHTASIINTPDAPRSIGEWESDYRPTRGRFVDDIIPVIAENYQRYVN